MNDDHLAAALRAISDVWELQRSGAFSSLQLEGRIERLPDLSPERAAAVATDAKALLARLDAIDGSALPPSIDATLSQARHACRVKRHASDWYWTVIDPAGVGFYGLFLPTPYCGGFVLNLVFQGLTATRFERDGDFDRYLGLVSDLGELIEQMARRTAGQAERGMRMPKAQIPSARALAAGMKARTKPALDVDASRVAARLAGRTALFSAELARRIEVLVEPAFDRLAAIFDASYEERAPQTVGIGQYAGGAAIYDELIRLNTTLPLTVAQVHAEGLRRLHGIETEMRAIRAEVGLVDDPAAYLDRVRADPRFSATTTEGVAAIFQRYIDRMEAVFDRAFHSRPQVPYGVGALPEALQAGMTFGYYEAPKPGSPEGKFLFNPTHLTKTPLCNVAALTYHELVPGHHLHLTTQQGNELLHPLGRFGFCNAFNEGWAEYAATLAGELGLYAAPEERYGRLLMDGFLTCRLVVDTGMNVLGWSLERAREFLREHSAMSEAEIGSETLRYACDIPAQALAYKLGDSEMLRMRERMMLARGDRFDVKDFHAAVLRHGAMPLPDLAAQLERAG